MHTVKGKKMLIAMQYENVELRRALTRFKNSIFLCSMGDIHYNAFPICVLTYMLLFMPRVLHWQFSSLAPPF
jgi:hypothetical protein